MGKSTGFLEFERRVSQAEEPLQRIRHFNEFHTPLTEEEQREQGARCMDCGVPFCQAGVPIGGMVVGCPLHNLVPEWNDLVYRGNYKEALVRLLKTNPLPEFTSRVCPALCEKACTCSLHGASVTVQENERAIVEYGYEEGLMHPQQNIPRTGKCIAVIGSGPAGLAAAQRLNQRGQLVTVLEREDKAGGLLRYGIPNMKLEKQYIDRRVAKMEQEGIRFQYNHSVHTAKQAASVCREYDAVLLACGSTQPRDLQVTGRDAAGVYFAVEFLKATTKALWNNTLQDENTYISAKGKDVLIIGGGDTGNDCVGTSIRHGARSVLQLEMMPPLPECRQEDNPWPEWPRVQKTDYGQQESIAVFGRDPRLYETTVKEFKKDEAGQLYGAVLQKLRPVQDVQTGRTIMEPIEGSEWQVDCQLAIIATGFVGCELAVTKAFNVVVNERGRVKTTDAHYVTDQQKVFTAGDMHRGQSLVVWAIKEGCDAAREIDEYLMGYSNL